MPSSIRRVAIASSSSTCEIAKPTWIRTQSPGSGAVAVRVQEPDVDVALYPGDVDFRDAVGLVDHFKDLARYRQAHQMLALSQVVERFPL